MRKKQRMITRLSLVAALATLCLCASGGKGAAEPVHVVWQIGDPDRDNKEFAHAPNGFSSIKEDALFVVGRSEARKDWPYVQPGPEDNWAGSRDHAYIILFGLDAGASEAGGRLVLDLLDTHSTRPPRLRISINDQSFERELEKGAGDASVNGEPAKGKFQQWAIPLRAGLLRTGENEISLTTLSGSWLLYDSIRLEASEPVRVRPVAPRTIVAGITVPPVWLKGDGQSAQPVEVTIRHIGEPMEGMLSAADAWLPVQLKSGLQSATLMVPASKEAREVRVELKAGESISRSNLVLRPPAIKQMWILPHSHVDIGYTHQQEQVVKAQVGHIKKALELAEASRGEPNNARFKWNPEAVWVIDHYLQSATPAERSALISAIQNGVIGVEGLYANILTALCRPEELAQCFSFAARVANLTGKPIRAATICDVPGYTWGIVPVMAQAGVRYFAIGPNFQDRVGRIHIWDDKPFYWQAQSGSERVLCWVVDNYHHLGDLEQNVRSQVDRQIRNGFPYDTSFLLWVGRWPDGAVDNAPPDEDLVQKVKAWNAKYAAPEVKIGLTADFFSEFERQHGKALPQYAGDLTPYWEDGAGSTSRETAMNRASADRLSQAAAVFAMRKPENYSAERFAEAWKNVLLYSEHTWGAWCSISKPDDAFTLDQWKTKQQFALKADLLSKELLAQGLETGSGSGGVEVVNPTQWERDDVVVAPPQQAGTTIISVLDQRGRAVPVQRLASGELAFLARKVPAFGSRSYTLSSQTAASGRTSILEAEVGVTAGRHQYRVGIGNGSRQGFVSVEGSTMQNGILKVEVDRDTGAIKGLFLRGIQENFVDQGTGLNAFRYVLGEHAAGAESNGPASVKVIEAGPLVGVIRVESEAPGCRKLVREIRMAHGQDRVEIINHVDRLSVREKDSVHFGFGFDVPGAMVRMETPWGVVRPNIDQLPGANRNWFTVQRWVDVSNKSRGITWAPLDAPLLQLGEITANLLGAVAFERWMTNAIESPVLYSWAQNNHWHTNYKIDQPGITTFRYILRPHKDGFSAADAARFGHETTRPLLVAPASSSKAAKPFVRISSDDGLLETLKISDDGKAVILRLFGVGTAPRNVDLKWGYLKPRAMWLSDLTERPVEKVTGRVHVPARGIVTLRVEQ
jgi:hypothetical protein